MPDQFPHPRTPQRVSRHRLAILIRSSRTCPAESSDTAVPASLPSYGSIGPAGPTPARERPSSIARTSALAASNRDAGCSSATRRSERSACRRHSSKIRARAACRLPRFLFRCSDHREHARTSHGRSPQSSTNPSARGPRKFGSSGSPCPAVPRRFHTKPLVRFLRPRPHWFRKQRISRSPFVWPVRRALPISHPRH